MTHKVSSAGIVLVTLLGLLTGLLFGTGCSSIAFKADFDETAEFGNYTTFHLWQPGTQPAGAQTVNPITLRRIDRAIELTLITRGMRSDSRRSADLLIVYHTGAEQNVDVDALGYTYGARWRESATREFGDKSLIIDFIDRERMEVIWRGWAKGVVGSPEQTPYAVNSAVKSILDQYPPPR